MFIKLVGWACVVTAVVCVGTFTVIVFQKASEKKSFVFNADVVDDAIVERLQEGNTLVVCVDVCVAVLQLEERLVRDAGRVPNVAVIVVTAVVKVTERMWGCVWRCVVI